ncbi:rod linker polypeptide CpcD [Chondrocystis sp. NIES-4102]|nr:rod linker polypeptide CpcD [Chondrocystis sp. NIES-4102]
MLGMITTGNSSISEYGSRIAIQVTGVCRQDVMRTSNYTVKVPYSRMSQTMQNISRMGGKVTGVSVGGTAMSTTSATKTMVTQPEAKS